MPTVGYIRMKDKLSNLNSFTVMVLNFDSLILTLEYKISTPLVASTDGGIVHPHYYLFSQQESP